MKTLFPPLILAMSWSLAACSGCKSLLVTTLSPEYEALAAPPSSDRRVDFLELADGYQQVTDLKFLPSQPTVIMVLEQKGPLRWLDLKTKKGGQWTQFEVVHAAEQGALGLAFHPRFEANGSFILNRTVESKGRDVSRIEHWQVQPGCHVAACKPKQVSILMEVEQPYANHNGGQVAFGPDGFLYIGFGDGGWRGDPDGHGQNPATLLGSMLRIDVDRKSPGKPYAVPADNPGRRMKGAAPELFAYGLRNPWRYSFDPAGRLLVADVGQDRFEEVHIVEPGANLGWPIREASHCYEPRTGCPGQGLTDPIFELPRAEAASITGGYVYLGREIPWLHGRYLVGDFLTGGLWALELPDKASAQAKAEKLGVFPYRFSTFARGPGGEIYSTGYASGKLLKLIPRPEKR